VVYNINLMRSIAIALDSVGVVVNLICVDFTSNNGVVSIMLPYLFSIFISSLNNPTKSMYIYRELWYMLIAIRRITSKYICGARDCYT
jgi:hypothetical protein